MRKYGIYKGLGQVIQTWCKTLKSYVEKGFLLPGVIKDMASREIDDISECPPNKKLCTDEKIVQVEPKERKIRHKKVALLLAYLGDNYSGMQVNPEVKTIEGELFSALSKAEFIYPTYNNPHTLQFQRTARTDKGVSAAKQVVSFKIAENFSIEEINKHLPEDIKVFSAKKVTKGFNCKNDCTGRTYSYTLPTFALAPELHEEYPENYRINEETIQKTNEILHTYRGTHNFHNFTIKKYYNDPSVHRHIKHFATEKPFLHGQEEFITLTVKGQSFMFHQIRKMVGHMIAVLKGLVPENVQADVCKSQKFSVPLAPALGLMLEDVHFDRYDKRYGNDGIHETLKWDDLADEINDFRKNIISNIIKNEIEKKLMFNWILTLPLRSYDCDQTAWHCRNKDEIDGIDTSVKDEIDGIDTSVKDEIDGIDIAVKDDSQFISKRM